MNTGKGYFEEFDIRQLEAMKEKHPDHGGWFRVDEVVELKGSPFRVKAIKPRELRLKLLPKTKQAKP